MADNVQLSTNVGVGEVARTVDKNSKQTQVVILDLGGSGAESLGVPATGAKQDTGNTSLATIAGAVAGSEMQVDVVGAIPAGSAIIGKVGIDQTTPGTTNGVQVNAALPAGTNNIGDVDVLSVPADPFGVNADAASATGSISAKLRFIASTGIPITGSVIVTNAGTFVVQVDGTALTRLTDIETNTDSGAVVGNGGAATAQRVTLANDGTGVLATITTVTTVATVTTLVGSSIAHDSPDSGNPHKIGAKAQTTLSDNTLVADNDRTDVFADLDGVLLGGRKVPLGDISRGLAAITDGSSTSVISAAGANVKTYITDVIIANSSSSNVTVDLRDGTGGSVLATFPVPANGGVVHRFETPIAFSANTAVAADPSAAASTITVTLCGFKSKV